MHFLRVDALSFLCVREYMTNMFIHEEMAKNNHRKGRRRYSILATVRDILSYKVLLWLNAERVFTVQSSCFFTSMTLPVCIYKTRTFDTNRPWSQPSSLAVYRTSTLSQ